MGDRTDHDWPWLPPPGGAGAGLGGGPEPLSELLARRLLEQRVVVLHGPLDDLSVTRISAELMTLDAEGDDPVTLRVDCGEAGLGPALTLMDVIELMGVPVRALCLGLVGQGAVGVVAVCAHRAGLPSTRFSLCEPTTQLEAHVRNVAQWAEMRAGERRRFCERRRCRRRPAGRRGRRGRRAGSLPRCGRSRRVRHPRRGQPARRRHPPPAGLGARAATHRVPPAALRGVGRVVLPAEDPAQPACLRCGHGRTRTPHGTPPRRRVGRAPDPAARALARWDDGADAHLHDPGPGRPGALPPLARLRRGAPLRAPARPAARAGDPAHRLPLRRAVRVGPAHRVG